MSRVPALLILILCLVLVAPLAAGSVTWQITPGTINIVNGPPQNAYAVGMVFTVGASDITVYDLGYYYLSGITGSQEVIIDGTSADAVIPACTAGTAVDGYCAAAISPVTLNAGTAYELYVLTGFNQTWAAWYAGYGGSAPTIDPDITWNGSNFAGNADGHYPHPYWWEGTTYFYYGANFSTTAPTGTVPEPSTWMTVFAVLLVLAGAGFARKRSSGTV